MLASFVTSPVETKSVAPVPVPKTLMVLPPAPPLTKIPVAATWGTGDIDGPTAGAGVSSTRDVRFWPEKLATVLPPRLTVLLVIAYVAPEPPRVSSIVSAAVLVPV